jgi:hypothetical protein
MCVVREKKKERQGVHGWWGKEKGNKKEKRNGEWSTWVVGKRKKEIKRKKEMESGVHGWWGKEKRK